MPEGARPLVGGRSGRFLQELSGCATLGHYVRTFTTLNLLDYFPGKDGKGDRFPMMEARIEARKLTPLLQGRSVIFVGMQVAEAFGAIAAKFYEWRLYPSVWSIDGFQGAPIPHPSGINHHWNDKENVERAKQFFAHTLRG